MKLASIVACLSLAVCALTVLESNALAQDSIAGIAVQDCVDNAVPDTVHACQISNPGNPGKADALVVSAGVVADRAALSCRGVGFKSIKACVTCYDNARKPLNQRFDGELFHGLLYNAAQIVVAERNAKCTPIGLGVKK